jgi:(p)ppGpp synthase/HD superfamily hydrolase
MTDATSDAARFIDDAYRERLRRPNRTPDHPIAVAQLLAQDGQAPPIVIAGLLHDVLEDTDVTADELRVWFGPEVARLVEALTQDEAISDYGPRKAALRQSVLASGPDAATIALADKVAKLQRRKDRPKIRSLVHYRATLEGIEKRYGRSRLSDQLAAELDGWKGIGDDP